MCICQEVNAKVYLPMVVRRTLPAELWSTEPESCVFHLKSPNAVLTDILSSMLTRLTKQR